MALESMDLRGYDLVISSESGPAKGVLTSSDTKHVCYCHSPMRYLWDLYPAYLHDWTSSIWKKAAMAMFGCPLRIWDYAAAARVDEFAANSRNVQKRVWKAYRREAAVIYPPVAVETFRWMVPGDSYLIVSELVAYKRIGDAVQCCTRTGRRLKIVGDGPEYASLKKQAGPSVEFCGRVSEGELRGLYARCRALLMPGEEDFGIVAVEAMASGKPVVALGRGGVLEAVPPEGRGAAVFYTEPGDAPLEQALKRFEEVEAMVRPTELQAWAERFSESRFGARMSELIGKSRETEAFLPGSLKQVQV
jgi:glycosyltransferase involved in cell wall biosynthesis